MNSAGAAPLYISSCVYNNFQFSVPIYVVGYIYFLNDTYPDVFGFTLPISVISLAIKPPIAFSVAAICEASAAWSFIFWLLPLDRTKVYSDLLTQVGLGVLIAMCNRVE